MSDDLRCFYCPCPATRRHRFAWGDVGWCEHHYWHVPAAVGGIDLPCPGCTPAEAAVA